MAIMKFEKPLPRAASVMAVTSLVSDGASRKRGAGAAIRVAAAGERTPLRIGAMRKVRETGEGGDVRNREPVARGLHFADLRADVLREVRKRVALADASFRRDFLVATGERNRL